MLAGNVVGFKAREAGKTRAPKVSSHKKYTTMLEDKKAEGKA